ncbi:proline-rich receptor-like protein kinase PERK10 isoform X2 [Manihot esculenta]|uniref:Uncharacterized protein n=2 Tax=Manihot esculenta TaxID=3983 RepID=A0ACB7G8H2_MANES|nr:proline-rich receptor-like protein kinase PERK10 isoform X2 [Manihot esculenta]KAG8636547.1 hypothetical protein MANES_15G008800v8 [Manihot esculenta]KAG8636550.1 hypothetical protein MANES_15G008800v8 [Manihot esculenta]
MAPELEKPQVTEIQVRMDCNGCVQKIKKALHGIRGIYDLYIDFPQQKLTVIGWADPEQIVKAIRKTRKIATICSHTEPSDQPAAHPTEPPQPPPEGAATPPPNTEAANPSPAALPAEASSPAEPPKDPPPPENPPPADKPSSSQVDTETNAKQPAGPAQAPGQKDVGEVHVIYHHPPDYGYRYSYPSYGGPWNIHPNNHGLPSDPRYPNGHGLPPEPRYPNGHGLPPEPRYPNAHVLPRESPQPIYVTHSYNTYRPSPYVTEYEYIHSPPRHTIYSRMDHYSEDYHENTRNGNITSIFSDENPNACRIV